MFQKIYCTDSNWNLFCIWENLRKFLRGLIDRRFQREHVSLDEATMADNRAIFPPSCCSRVRIRSRNQRPSSRIPRQATYTRNETTSGSPLGPVMSTTSDNCIDRITRCLITVPVRHRPTIIERIKYRETQPPRKTRQSREFRRNIGDRSEATLVSGFSCHKDSCITQGCRASRQRASRRDRKWIYAPAAPALRAWRPAVPIFVGLLGASSANRAANVGRATIFFEAFARVGTGSFYGNYRYRNEGTSDCTRVSNASSRDEASLNEPTHLLRTEFRA